jgi:hypothetical protein
LAFRMATTLSSATGPPRDGWVPAQAIGVEQG